MYLILKMLAKVCLLLVLIKVNLLVSAINGIQLEGIFKNYYDKIKCLSLLTYQHEGVLKPLVKLD